MKLSPPPPPFRYLGLLLAPLATMPVSDRRFHDLPGRGGLNPWPAGAGSLVAHRVRTRAEFRALDAGAYALANLGEGSSVRVAPGAAPGAPPELAFVMEVNGRSFDVTFAGAAQASGTAAEVCRRFGLLARDCEAVHEQFRALAETHSGDTREGAA